MQQNLDVAPIEIKRLNSNQLAELLRTLLRAEAHRVRIPQSCIQVSHEINTRDGGLDAVVQWSGDPDPTDWLTRDIGFQCKATEMGPTACKNELLNSAGTELKIRVKELLERNGRYVLFCNQPGVLHERMDKMHEALNLFGIANADIKIYDQEQIATWTNQYMAAKVMVKEALRQPMPYGIQTLHRLRGYTKLQTKFVSDKAIDEHLNTIRQATETLGPPLRITGLSELGKTRLILEAFKADEYQRRVVYVNAALDRGQLAHELVSWMRGLYGILVVDNCDKKLHEALTDEIRHDENQVNLVVIDFNPDMEIKNQLVIKLDRMPANLIKEILEHEYPDSNPADLSRMIEFADGFPGMAVRLGEARLMPASSLATLTEKQLVDKLLFEPGHEDAEAKRVMRACSLFTRVKYNGATNPISEELKFIAEKIVRIDPQKFHEHFVNAEKRGVLQVGGDYARVVPKPLASRLASDWYESCSIDLAQNIIKEKMATATSKIVMRPA